MQKSAVNLSIESSDARSRLPLSAEPVWISCGTEDLDLRIGYRKTSKVGQWLAALTLHGQNQCVTLGSADDHEASLDALSFAQATEMALRWAHQQRGVAVVGGRPTVSLPAPAQARQSGDARIAAIAAERDEAVAAREFAEARAASLKADRDAALSTHVALKAQLALLTDERAFLARELSKAYRRPWRPFKYSLNSALLQALATASEPFNRRMAESFRRSARKRSPHRFDSFLAPPPPISPRPKPVDGVLLQEDLGPLTSADAAAIRLPTSATPLVSIIIPCFGKASLTLQCLASIAKHPPTAPFEVIVVDDASGDPEINLLREVSGLRLEVNAENLGFVRSCNRAATLAHGEYLFFLNNDTVVMDRWLEPLLDVFARFPDAGLVGSKLLFPDGSLQEAGGIVWNDGSAWNYGRSDHPDKPQYNYVREADYISGCAILVPRPLWERLGGFDERFAPAYYEDTDLAFRIREALKKVYYCPLSVIVHLEGASMGTDLNAGLKAYQLRNKEKFLDRWRERLSHDQFLNGTNIMRARDRNRGKKIALIIDHYIPQPDQDAGSRTIIAMIEALIDGGYTVKFWPDNLAYDANYTSRLQSMGVEVLYNTIYCNFDIWIKENGDALSKVILSRPAVAQRYIPALMQETNATLVYYGHDLHFLRLRMEADRTSDAQTAAKADEMEDIERNIWKAVDVVLYLSPEETAVARTVARRAETVMAFVFPDFAETREPPDNKDIVFVAGFAHPPNIDAAVWLVKDILPLVWAHVPEARVSIMGANPTETVRALANDRVTVTGRVSEDELRDSYARSRVAIVPLRIGAGVKSKVVEALREGLPLVTTTVGAQGLPGVENAAHVTDEAAELAARVVHLLQDDDLWLSTSTRQVDYARRHFSVAPFRRTFLEAIGHRPAVEGVRLP